MNATAAETEGPRYVLLNGRIHRGTCKRRGTLKGTAAPVMGDAAKMHALRDGHNRPATCCKPERSADWKAAAVKAGAKAVGAKVPDLAAVVQMHTRRKGKTIAGVNADGGLTVIAETEHVDLEPTPATEHGVLNSDRFDTTERAVTLRHDGQRYAATYIRRAYRKDAVKPYSGTWLLANGVLIEGGPSIGYTVRNGGTREDAGRGPLGAIAARFSAPLA